MDNYMNKTTVITDEALTTIIKEVVRRLTEKIDDNRAISIRPLTEKHITINDEDPNNLIISLSPLIIERLKDVRRLQGRIKILEDNINELFERLTIETGSSEQPDEINIGPAVNPNAVIANELINIPIHPGEVIIDLSYIHQLEAQLRDKNGSPVTPWVLQNSPIRFEEVPTGTFQLWVRVAANGNYKAGPEIELTQYSILVLYGKDYEPTEEDYKEYGLDGNEENLDEIEEPDDLEDPEGPEEPIDPDENEDDKEPDPQDPSDENEKDTDEEKDEDDEPGEEEDLDELEEPIPLREEKPNISINFIKECLMGFIVNEEYYINGEIYKIGCNCCVNIKPSWFGTQLYIIKLSTKSDIEDSLPQRLDIPDRPNKPELTVINATTENSNDGQIQDVNTLMEYRNKNDIDWKEIIDDSLIDLSPGIYFVRIAASSDNFKSLVRKIKIKVIEHTLPTDPDELDNKDPDPEDPSDENEKETDEEKDELDLSEEDYDENDEEDEIEEEDEEDNNEDDEDEYIEEEENPDDNDPSEPGELDDEDDEDLEPDELEDPNELDE
jgi:hypothetical protein